MAKKRKKKEPAKAKFPPGKLSEFLRAVRVTGDRHAAARAMSIHSSTFRKYLRDDQVFKAAVQTAEDYFFNVTLADEEEMVLAAKRAILDHVSGRSETVKHTVRRKLDPETDEVLYLEETITRTTHAPSDAMLQKFLPAVLEQIRLREPEVIDVTADTNTPAHHGVINQASERHNLLNLMDRLAAETTAGEE